MYCKSILIVEDEEDIRETVAIILRQEGYEVSTASNGKEALELFPKMTFPPLVLLDMMMPEMSGWDFLRIQSEKGMADFPVVLMSAVTPMNALVGGDGQMVHAEGMLEKPVDVDSLLKTVSHYCQPVHATPDADASATDPSKADTAAPLALTREIPEADRMPLAVKLS